MLQRIDACLLCLLMEVSICLAQGNDRKSEVGEDHVTSSLEFSHPADVESVKRLSQEVERLKSAAPRNEAALIEALVALGTAQARTGDISGAQGAYGAALALAEKQGSASDRLVVAPLEGLGRISLRKREYAAAADQLGRAIRITQRTHGLLFLGQCETLDELATAQTELGRYEDAERSLQYLIQVQEHAFGRRNARVVPAYTRLAEWYSFMGDLDTSRLMLRRVLQIAEAEFGAKSVELVRPLRALSRSYHVELLYGPRVSNKLSDRELLSVQAGASSRGPTSISPEALLNASSRAAEGERSIVRAAEIADALPGSVDEDVQTFLEAGDWFSFKENSEKSIECYTRALEASRADPGYPKILVFPQLIFLPPIAQPKEEEAGRYVAVEFSVAADGRVSNVAIVEGDATDKAKKEVEKSVRVARYRPRFVDDKPVETKAMRYRHVFH